MYVFELIYTDMTTNEELTKTIEVDSTPFDMLECSELDIYQAAMAKAYNFCKENDFYMFDSLSLIAC